MDILAGNAKWRGRVNLPTSKSVAHRHILCGALSKGETRLTHCPQSEDVRASLRAAEALGAKVVWDGDEVTVIGGEPPKEGAFYCGESGSTLRFMMPIAAALGGKWCINGQGRLLQRPQKALTDLLQSKGINLELHDAYVMMEGGLKPGEYVIDASESSQYVSGLLMALSMLPGPSRVIAKNLSSRPYVNITLDALARHGAYIRNEDDCFYVPGFGLYKASIEVEGDFSQAAFFLTADMLGAEVYMHGLRKESAQGDAAILSILERAGGVSEGGIAMYARELKSFTLNASDVPDLVPVLAVLGCLVPGVSKITHAGRLRGKECDRLAAMTDTLSRLGGHIMETPDGLVMEGQEELEGGIKVHAWNDHRVAMALAVAALKCRKPIVIEGAECVKKSYPNFWNDLNHLGADIRLEERQ